MLTKPPKLIHYTPLPVASDAIRTCYQSFGKSDTCEVDGETVLGDKDRELIHRVSTKLRHGSTIEHINYTFYVHMSRACLQEWARHRMASLSVKSSRYTLKELGKEEPFSIGDWERAGHYVVFTGTPEVDEIVITQLNNLLKLVKAKLPNDLIKYAMPEAYRTEMTWTVNARSLQNFLALRTSSGALWEIRDLANAVFEVLPEDHKYLFEECVSE